MCSLSYPFFPLSMSSLIRLLVCSLFFSFTLSQRPWYQAVEMFEPEEMHDRQCTQECSTTIDCSTELSCFHATADSKGCCLPTLKPNETGCVVDDQCKRACDSTLCDKTQTPSRCLCERGRHFLFNKCWKKCPDFAFPEPEVDDKGFSYCRLKTDTKTAMNYMRRFRRQLRSAFC